jgi:hypothetical protein
MLPPENGAFEVRKMGAHPSEGSLFTSRAYQYSSYSEFPIGRYRLGVFRKGEITPIKVFDVDLKQETFFTILVSPRSIDMFDDTIDPKSSSGTLTIWNFFLGISLSVSCNSKSIVEALETGQSYQATGFALGSTTVKVQAKLPDGKAAQSDLDIDFKQCSRATLLIIPDSYGRFRPQVTFDGKNL